MEQVTLSVEELKQLISDEVKKELENSKPIKNSKIKELEEYFKNAVYDSKIEFNWYSAWSSFKMANALKMGYRVASKIPLEKQDEFYEMTKKDVEDVLEIFKGKKAHTCTE